MERARFVNVLATGQMLSDKLPGRIYVYRWVPDYADPTIRPGDYVLLDPEEGRHYGGKKGKRLTARVDTRLLEYRQNDEFVFRGDSPKRAYVDNPTATGKATYTGDRCDGMAAALVNWLTEHAEEVPYRQFAKHVDVRSFDVGPLSRCGHCTFLRTTLPSGGPAWVLQWSGFEHLAVDDPGALDIEHETELASDWALSPTGDPVVWWDDAPVIEALGGLARVAWLYEAAAQHAINYDQPSYAWKVQPIAWIVPRSVMQATGLVPQRKDHYEVERFRRAGGKLYEAEVAGRNPTSRPRENPTTDPLDQLSAFLEFVDWMSQVPDESYRASARLRAIPAAFGRRKLGTFFLGLLQHYDPTSKDRTVLEKAAKEYQTTRTRIGRDPVAQYKLRVKALIGYLDAVERTLERPKEHAEPEVHGMRLVNAGGFSPKVMEAAGEVVAKAAEALGRVGLGRALYGDVTIVNSVHRNPKALAFYWIETDELYVRANLKGQTGPAVKTVLHELAHRIEDRLLAHKRAEIRTLFKRIEDESDQLMSDALWKRSDLRPSEGQSIGEEWRVVKIGLSKNKPAIVVVSKLNRARVGWMPLHKWLLNHHYREVSAFVSLYASTDPSENFAEMLATYALGQLELKWVDLLTPILADAQRQP